mmetsp:Transcript_25384/g.76482  ORF Transcript_25384/g.76482 Transcript_25384/m.76482 type:complete len:302 (+) Transcript_25384:34-939(+)
MLEWGATLRRVAALPCCLVGPQERQGPSVPSIGVTARKRLALTSGARQAATRWDRREPRGVLGDGSPRVGAAPDAAAQCRRPRVFCGIRWRPTGTSVHLRRRCPRLRPSLVAPLSGSVRAPARPPAHAARPATAGRQRHRGDRSVSSIAAAAAACRANRVTARPGQPRVCGRHGRCPRLQRVAPPGVPLPVRLGDGVQAEPWVIVRRTTTAPADAQRLPRCPRTAADRRHNGRRAFRPLRRRPRRPTTRGPPRCFRGDGGGATPIGRSTNHPGRPWPHRRRRDRGGGVGGGTASSGGSSPC